MLDIAGVTAVVGAVTSMVGLTDKVFESWRRFREAGDVKTPPTATPDYFEKVEAAPGGGLAHVADGQVTTVTREDLSARLGPQEKQVIEALERQMSTLVAQWSAITRDYDLTIDPAQKAILKIKLDDICLDLSQALLRVTQMLELVGFHLRDHYGAVRMIASTRQ